MSTRANIVIQDGYDSLWFYRHSDGYPDGAMPTLKKFMSLIKNKYVRANAGQSSGWLIIIGYQEYNGSTVNLPDTKEKDLNMSGWKVGAYEPTVGRHADIDFLYELDLVKMEIRIKGYDSMTGGFKVVETITEFD